MARKKSVAPDPKDQELDQTAEAADGVAADETAENDGAPSEETLALMEQEYLASSADGGMPTESGSDIPIGDAASDGDTTTPGEDLSVGGEQAFEEQAVSAPGDTAPADDPECSSPSNDEFSQDGPSEDSPTDDEDETADDYAALLKELGEAGTDGAEEPPLLDRKSTRLNSSHGEQSRMPSSA